VILRVRFARLVSSQQLDRLRGWAHESLAGDRQFVELCTDCSNGVRCPRLRARLDRSRGNLNAHLGLLRG
jgi:hypothetical protein